ncbi:fibronectin type III domain-containing protein [Streptomyces sp. NPDC058947]|uniref:fibronectin type III domain-containing protein n=1 Tax=Streptomyces sp. NPDC058947 TaxID=3346675 RepID=UPI0036AFA707
MARITGRRVTRSFAASCLAAALVVLTGPTSAASAALIPKNVPGAVSTTRGEACMIDAPKAIDGPLAWLAGKEHLGHVAWSFNRPGTDRWWFGSTDGAGITWRDYGSKAEMVKKFTGLKVYSKMRCGAVRSPNISKALEYVAQSIENANQFNAFANNCLTNSVAILSAYGVPLSNKGQLTDPNDYFNNEAPSAGLTTERNLASAGPPPPPPSPSFNVKPNAESVTVAWTRVSSEGGVREYQLGDGETTQSFSWKTTSYTWDDLRSGQYKCFHMRAISRGGVAGSWSAYQCTTTAASGKKPSLYVSTGYERGSLYESSHFPEKIGLDNHEWYSDLQWGHIGPSSAKATGTLHENKCEPSCAEGEYVTYPIEVIATDPVQCAVEVYDRHSDEMRIVQAYVFNEISARALSGKPRPDLVGDEVFKTSCSSSPAQPPTSSETPSAPAVGEVPQEYLGTWDSRIDNATGHHTRRLVIQQGEVGDAVVLLTADGPTKAGGKYHCVFTAELTSAPTADGPLHIGPSTVTAAEPPSACTPGTASTVTLVPDGRLRRVNADGEQLTYTKAD